MEASDAIAGLALVLSVLFGWWNRSDTQIANKEAREANRLAAEANLRADRSEEIARTANAYAREANGLAHKAYDAEYVTSVYIHWGRYVDLHQDPPIGQLHVAVTNLGRNPVMIVEVYVRPFDDRSKIVDIGSDRLFGRAGAFQLPQLLAHNSSIEFYLSMDALKFFEKSLGKSTSCVLCVIDSTGREHESRKWSPTFMISVLETRIEDVVARLALLKSNKDQ